MNRAVANVAYFVACFGVGWAMPDDLMKFAVGVVCFALALLTINSL